MTRRAFHLTADACTHVGRKRVTNEDAFLLTDDLLAVADGLGGHSGGDLASATAIEALHASAVPPTPDGLLAAMAAAHWAVLNRAALDPEFKDMCTTMTILALDPAGVVVLANVGDSRSYRFSGRRLSRISWDHIWENEFILRGMPPEVAAGMDDAHKLSRVVGVFDEPCEADVWSFEAADGDRYLLASDGLTLHVPDDEIAAVLRRADTPGEACETLVDRANDRGGLDNITVVVADVVESDGRRGRLGRARAAHS